MKNTLKMKSIYFFLGPFLIYVSIFPKIGPKVISLLKKSVSQWTELRMESSPELQEPVRYVLTHLSKPPFLLSSGYNNT